MRGLIAPTMVLAGFDFQPGTRDLYFTFLERDWFGNNQPDDYLEMAPLQPIGKNFGWPYCHWVGSGPPDLRSLGPGSALADNMLVAPAEEPLLANPGPNNASLNAWCQGVVFRELCTLRREYFYRVLNSGPILPMHAANAPAPVQALGPHVAALGVKFANGTNFPAEWSGNNTLFIAEHGSWNRDFAIGYRIAVVQVDSGGHATNHTVFASGWLQNENTPQQNFWGRPNHLLFLPDGSLLVSDDYANTVYKISFSGGNVAAQGR